MAAISVSSAWNSTFGNGTNSSFSTLPPAARKPSLKEARDSSPAAYFQVMNTAFLWPLSAVTLPSGCTGCQLENDVRNTFGEQSAPVAASDPALGMSVLVQLFFATLSMPMATP